MGTGIEIAGIGACVADTLYTIPQFPPEDTKLRATGSRQVGGGPVATGLVAASRLGVGAAYLGNLSEDSAGRFLAADFERYGVDISGVTDCEAGLRSFTSCIWINRENGSRTCVFDKGTLPSYRLSQRAEEIIKQAVILMVDGNELDAAVEAAQLIHRFGGKVLYDAGGLYEGVERLLPLADVLIPSAEFACGFTGEKTVEEAAERLFALFSPEAVVVTDGSRGGVFTQGGMPERYEVFPVEAVDTNGAGDVFHGAFAAGMRKGYSLRNCCTFASMVSSIKCCGLGARESIPDFARVEAALREKGAWFQ